MPQLFPPEILENTVECYHARISTRSKVIYELTEQTYLCHRICPSTKSQTTDFKMWQK